MWTVIAICVFVTSALPLLGYSIDANGVEFVGQTYNVDDTSVYMSWARQAADGHFFIRNLFTTEPQKGHLFNVLFLLVGLIVRVTSLPISVVFFLFREIGAVGLLLVIYWFYRIVAAESPQIRLTAFTLTAFGTGLAWTFWPRWADKNVGLIPTDAWQPELLTFLSIDVSMLFVISTTLIVLCMIFLLQAEQTGQFKFAAYAGCCGLILGNIHSYDVIHIGSAWAVYCLARGLLLKRIPQEALTVGVIALLIAIPTTLYQLYQFKTDSVFYKRAELTYTLAPPFIYYVLGYGLTFAFGVIGAIYVISKHAGREDAPLIARSSAWLFTVCWAAGGFVAAYMPKLSFQRKMIMGTDVPLALLAALGAVELGNRLAGSKKWAAAIPILLVAFSLPSSALWLYRDYNHLINNRSETNSPPFLGQPEVDMLHWVRKNTQPSDALIGFPEYMVYIPGYCDRAIWIGHWSETPDYGHSLRNLVKFMSVDTPDDYRAAWLEATHTEYFVYPTDPTEMTKPRNYPGYFNFAAAPPPYLKPVYRNKEFTIFQEQF